MALNPLCRNASYALKEIQILYTQDRKEDYPYVTGLIAGRWFEAAVYNEPSEYGIDKGRISRLAVGKDSMRDRRKGFADQCDYYYDRGNKDEFISNLPEQDVQMLVTALNKLEPVQL